MAKSLKDVLAGVKSSKTVKLDHKDMYQWNSPDGLKFVDDKHPVEKHADRVGNGDDVYNGKTKPAKYPRQTDSVYEEAEELDEVSKEKVKKYKSGANKWFKDEMHKRGAYEVEASRKGGNRYKGLETASNKLDGKSKVNATEETDVTLEEFVEYHLEEGYDINDIINFIEENYQLDELSKETLSSYAKKAVKDKEVNRLAGSIMKKKNFNSSKYDRKLKNREAGLEKANKKLAKEETDGNIINQKLGAGEKKTAIVEGKYSCTMTEAGKECPEHGLKECPGYKGSKQLLTDKKMKCEGIQIGKALRVGSDYTDTHLARRKRDTNSLGKPASLLDRATKTIDKLKGSRLSLKRLTEEELDELNKVLVSYIKKAAGEMKKIANKDPMNTTFKDTDTYFKREKGVEKAKEKLNEVAPPNPKIEKWIKANKERFVKEYGPKKGKEVLYAKAWKMHSQSESGNSPATNSDYAGPGAAGWTTGRLDVGTL